MFKNLFGSEYWLKVNYILQLWTNNLSSNIIQLTSVNRTKSLGVKIY